MTRRSLLFAALAASGRDAAVRAITRGPKFHWFGYYDKLEFDPSGRYVLANEVDFEHRTPLASDKIRVGVVDTRDGKDAWIEIGESSAWNWQQGCMLQWRPGSRSSEIVWNDRVDGQFVAHVLDFRTRRKRTIPSPVYTLSPDGKWGLVCDFPRLNHTRPGYGYAGIEDPNRMVAAPENSGIWRVDMETGKRTLLFSIADIVKIPHREPYSKGAVHWFNHLLISPDGKRFIFLHRWRGEKEGRSFSTRMFTADADGRGLYVVDPYGKTSHFIWRDPAHIAAWAWHPSHGERFYLYRDKSETVEVIGKDVMTVNGHLSYLPGRRSEWILNDTYPDKERMQNPFLYYVPTGRRVPLGSFHAPTEYTGEWRCDTHPRVSPDGTKVVIDSAHGGNGRQLYLIDIAGLAG